MTATCGFLTTPSTTNTTPDAICDHCAENLAVSETADGTLVASLDPETTFPVDMVGSLPEGTACATCATDNLVTVIDGGRWVEQ